MSRPGTIVPWTGATTRGAASWSAFAPAWATAWASCARRLRRWPIPPGWCAFDWLDEARAIGLAAAWQALGEYDPGQGSQVASFVRGRVMAALLTRYRQEWSYGSHCRGRCGLEAHASPNGSNSRELTSLLEALPAEDRWLIEQLFWHGAREHDLAAQLGITQSAVSRRKRAILRRLRELNSAGDAGLADSGHKPVA